MLFTIPFMLVVLYGSQAFALSEADFQAFGRKYGVSPHLLQAIAIIESQNGELLGQSIIKEVVRQPQLKYLQKIARHTGRSISEFKGSPSGAMGYMQIMPSTFYLYAQDGDGDGIKDPMNRYDSLATAAYFLARRFAAEESVIAAMRSYNNSSAYCSKVAELARQLEVQSRLASREDVKLRPNSP